MDNVKVFTPTHITTYMLKMAGYGSSDTILKKHVIDNSCGDGAILALVVCTYIEVYMHNDKNILTPQKKLEDLKRHLETYIHGIEIDPDLYGECIIKLDIMARMYGIEDVNWDIVNADALRYRKYDGKMDYVVGNPPYKNVHNFGDEKEFLKSFKFVGKGMTDLYIIFFERGLDMLNENGKLVYITPSSWTTSMAGRVLREYAFDTGNISDVLDFKNEQVFGGVTTFTMITVFDKKKTDRRLRLWKPDFENSGILTTLSLDDIFIDGKFFFSEDAEISNLMLKINKHDFNDVVRVKNGFATLNDKLFIVKDNDYCGLVPHEDNVITAFKASRGKRVIMIYPYNTFGTLYDFDELTEKTREYLLRRKNEIGLNSDNGEWWAYGRTQAIKDVNFNKIYVNNLISESKDLIFDICYSGEGVYSGFYITANNDETLSDVFAVLTEIKNGGRYSDLFIRYIQGLGKYKNGGYYTFSSKELQNFLNFVMKDINFI